MPYHNPLINRNYLINGQGFKMLYFFDNRQNDNNLYKHQTAELCLLIVDLLLTLELFSIFPAFISF